MDFFMPARLFTGEDCIAQHKNALAQLGSSCVLVVSKLAAQASGALNDVERALQALGITSFVWDGVAENPPVASCIEAGRFAAQKGARFVVGIGGGSALDAAKAVAVIAANPQLDESSFYAKAWEQDPLPIVLVGTTAGTGSEVTKVSVLTDELGRKHSIHDDRLYASVAFGDSLYTHSCPRAVTLSCGVDILAHAAESYFSHKADEISRAFAVRAVRLLLEPLSCVAHGGELDADQRRRLYEASLLGGLAINTTGTCFPHNVGYYLTETYGVPHGFACATFLPHMFMFVQDFDPAYAQAFWSEAGTDEITVNNLIKYCLPAYGFHMTEEQIDAALPRWQNNGSVQNTRADVSVATIREVLVSLFAQE